MKIVFVLSLLSVAHAAYYKNGKEQSTHVSCRAIIYRTDNSLENKDVQLFNNCCGILNGCTVNCYKPTTTTLNKHDDITTITCNMRNNTKLIAPFQKCYNNLNINRLSLCEEDPLKSTYTCEAAGTLTHSTCNQK